MSTKRFSPAAQLLRNSRLMAMPSQISPPYTSNINTPPASPYPTQQAITTPRSSAFRGDWGLKRSLPLAMSAKTMYMRYRDLDTIEHMTTFESAHDDVYTLKKWQELDVALTAARDLRPHGADTYSFNPTQSVFSCEGSQPEGYKWRYKGKFVDGLAGKELDEYISKKVLPRKQEFCDYVKERQNIDKLRNQYTSRGLSFTEESLRADAAALPVEEVNILALRTDRSYFEKLVKDFLDIPTSKPFTTHPSAGLHYARSNAHAYNDPVHGPQEKRKLVPGRHLNNVATTGPVVGVAGVVAKVNQGYGRPSAPQDRFKVNQYRPVMAFINNRGQILLEVDQALELQDRSASWREPQIPDMHFTGQSYMKRLTARAADAALGRPRPRAGMGAMDGLIDLLRSK